MKQVILILFVFMYNQLVFADTVSKPTEFWKQPIERHSYYEDKAKEHFAKEKPELKTKAKELLKHQQVKFLENKGQMTDMAGKPVPFVLFKAEAPGIDMYITEKGLTYVMLKHEEEEKEVRSQNSKEKKLVAERSRSNENENIKVEWHRIDMDLKGAIIKKENIIAEGKSNYFKQYFLSHCPDGITDVHDYEKITIKNIYPNIDWVLYNSNDKGFKYDFIAHPGADCNQIKMLYKSKEPIELDKEGNLIMKTEIGSLIENAPYTYAQENSQIIESSFIKKQLSKHETEISFNIEQSLFNNHTLIIDPQLVWHTFIGGNSLDGAMDVCSDVNNSVLITGYVSSTDFPIQSSGTFFQGNLLGISDIFIIKFDNNINLLWSTYYGGSDLENGLSIATDNRLYIS